MSESIQVLLPFSPQLPVEVTLQRYQGIEKHWHDTPELCFVLHGSADLLAEDRMLHLIPDDVCLLRSRYFHQIATVNCTFLCIHLRLEELAYFDAASDANITLTSAGETDSPRYHYLRNLMAQFVKLTATGEHRYKMLSLIYALLGHLTESFQSAPVSNLQTRSARVSEILGYIHTHYADGFTLAQLAAAQNMSVSYLSTFFEKNIGVSFLNYYNEVRLDRAVNRMLTSDEPLEEIALGCGFRDIRSFVAAFKKRYDCLPSVYRKQQTEALRVKKAAVPDMYEAHDELSGLAKYLTLYNGAQTPRQAAPHPHIIIDAGKVGFSQNVQTLRHNFHRMCCVGSARQFLYGEVQAMLRKAQAEIGYEYVKFHGILSDEMMVYTEQADGTPVYSFTLLDKVLDFIRSIGLRPLMQLSFMPIALASDPAKMVDMYNFNTSPPRDMARWADLVEAVTRHVVQRYGLEEVRRWPFCVWNEPDGSPDTFGWADTALFFRFFKESYHAVKRVDTQLRFGSPSLLVGLDNDESMAADFFRYCAKENCDIDFVNIHYYDNTFFSGNDKFSSFTLDNMQAACPLNSDPYAFMKFIRRIKAHLALHHMADKPLYLTEWNLTVSHRDLINDTCFKACYLAKNLLENYDDLDSYGYWCLTDFIEELQLPNELYHGGLGMFTYNGIPKAHYNIFGFMNRLGGTLLAKGNGYFITKHTNRIVALLYNYEHYSKLFAGDKLHGITQENRYAPFTEMNRASFQARFSELPYTSCIIKEMFVNQSRGSSYDAWMRMGGQPLTRTEDLELLRQESQPGMYLHRETIQNGILSYHTQMDPLEVRFVEIELL